MTHPRLILGDWNLSFADVQALAKQMGGKAVRGKGPDHAIVIGGQPVSVRVLGKHGSDAHHAVLFDFDFDSGYRDVRVLLWNVWVGQHPGSVRRSLRRLTRKHRPDVVVLNEAYRCGHVLQKIPGYSVYQGPNVGEGADVAVLVADRYKVRKSRALKMRETWTVVSKGRRKSPREYRIVRVKLDHALVLPILGIHGPTDNPINAAAVDESSRRVVRWAAL